MKKILVSLLVLALCAPAMAATISIDVSTPLTAVITIDSSADAVNMVGLGLDIDVDGGAAVQTVSVDTADFNIFPDAAYTQELGAGYVYGTGSPVAAKTVAGEIALPQSSFALSFGNLNGAAIPGATGAASVQVTVTVDAACNITVCENATRGGIVAVDGTALDAACANAAIGGGVVECVKSTAPFYADWVAWGKPDCWCYQKNCHGDADGIVSGPFRVANPDLQILLPAFNKIDGAIPAGGICADFDHLKSGPFRVANPDLQAFLPYFNKLDALVPVCDATNYNFWTN